jgi:hypothetical protein
MLTVFYLSCAQPLRHIFLIFVVAAAVIIKDNKSLNLQPVDQNGPHEKRQAVRPIGKPHRIVMRNKPAHRNSGFCVEQRQGRIKKPCPLRSRNRCQSLWRRLGQAVGQNPKICDPDTHQNQGPLLRGRIFRCRQQRRQPDSLSTSRSALPSHPPARWPQQRPGSLPVLTGRYSAALFRR